MKTKFFMTLVFTKHTLTKIVSFGSYTSSPLICQIRNSFFQMVWILLFEERFWRGLLKWKFYSQGCFANSGKCDNPTVRDQWSIMGAIKPSNSTEYNSPESLVRCEALPYHVERLHIALWWGLVASGEAHFAPALVMLISHPHLWFHQVSWTHDDDSSVVPPNAQQKHFWLFFRFAYAEVTSSFGIQ